MALNIVITDAGRQEIINAENNGTTPVTITEIALGTGQYAPSKTQTALSAEFKRLATISGEIVAADTIHVVLKDESNDGYTFGEFGLLTASGTLFAVYSQESADGYIAEKNEASTLLLAVDVVLSTLDAASLTFGDVSFTNPPASETVKGVVELADGAEALDGEDLERAMSPKRVHQAFGKYGVGKAFLLSDLNTNKQGFFLASATAANVPAGVVSNVWGITHVGDSVFRVQEAFSGGSNRAWIRYFNGSIWSAWQEIYHTGNNANKSEAEEGSIDNKAMTPLRSHQAFNKYGLGKSAPIPGSTDFRAYVDARLYPAFYHSGFGANSGLSGLPSDLRGALLAFASADQLKSMLFIAREDENAWLNIADASGAWRSWRKIHHSGNFDPALKANLTGNTFSASQAIDNGAGYGAWVVNRKDQSAEGNVDKVLVDVETGTGAARMTGITNSAVHGQLKMTPDQKLIYNGFLVWHEGDSPAQQQANGYQKLPSGLIVQWGSVSGLSYTATGNQNFPISFPIAFPAEAVLGIAMPTIGNIEGGGSSYTTENITKTGLRLTYSAAANISDLRFNWIAIGY